MLKKCGWRIKPHTLKQDLKRDIKELKEWLSIPELKEAAKKWIKELKKTLRFL